MENKETLEESACKALGYDYNKWILIHSKDNSTIIYNEITNWCKGATWQAERMYSEEDMRKAFSYYSQRLILGYEYIDVYFKEWMIKQFKKK